MLSQLLPGSRQWQKSVLAEKVLLGFVHCAHASDLNVIPVLPDLILFAAAE